MEFLVSDAERFFAEGGQVQRLSFWSFKIMTRSTLPAYQTPPLFPRLPTSLGAAQNCIVGAGYVDFCSWHRYSDFEWLSQMLKVDFPGVVFPPIPEKEADGTKDKLRDLVSFSGSDALETSKENPLVQKRMRRLQMFFNLMAKLTITHENKFFKAFVSMEEAEWLAFKAEETNKLKVTGWEGVKTKSFGFFSAILRSTKKPEVIFPMDSQIFNVRYVQSRYSDEIRQCMQQLFNIVRATQVESKKMDAPVEAVASGKPIPATLCYNGHSVKSLQDDSLFGVVRHVDNVTAWVEWNGQVTLTAVPISSLTVPNSGVSDPCMYAMGELMQQMESYFVYLCFRVEAREMDQLIDNLWFWHKYCEQIRDTINELETLERDRREVAEDASKEKKEPKKQELVAKAAAMTERFNTGSAKVIECYYSFVRPLQKKALLDIILAFGKLSVTLLADSDWEQRLMAADASLPLLFDVPAEVLQQQAQQQYQQQALQQFQQQAQPPTWPQPEQKQSASAAPQQTLPQYQQQQQSQPQQKQPQSPPQQAQRPQSPLQGPQYTQYHQDPVPRRNSTWAEPIPTGPVDGDLPPPTPPPATEATAPPPEEPLYHTSPTAQHATAPQCDDSDGPPPHEGLL